MAFNHHHPSFDEEDFETYNEEPDELLENIDEEEMKKHKQVKRHANARRSIDFYLERRRIRKQYHDFFDEDFDLDN